MKLTKEEFIIRCIENKIIDELKDSPVRGTAYIEKKYQGSGVDAGKINRIIINYQIKKYGETISPQGSFEFRTREEYKKIARQEKARRKRELGK